MTRKKCHLAAMEGGHALELYGTILAMRPPVIICFPAFFGLACDIPNKLWINDIAYLLKIERYFTINKA